MPGPAAPVAAVRGALRAFLTARLAAGDAAPGDLLVVACSGGADSLALAAQAAFVAPRLGLRAGLVTVDHGGQPGSAEVAAAVLAQARVLGLAPATARTVTLPPDGGPEGGARAARYAALEDARAELGARAVLLGHTMEDQAETVLLALGRGAGATALAGMAPVRGARWRPLLGVRRGDTVGACTALGLTAWADPTNAVDGPWRTAAGGALPRAAVRERVLPALADALGRDAVPALARTAERLRADQEALGEWAERVLAAGEADRVATLAALPGAVRGRVLRALLLGAGATPGDLKATHLDAVEALVTGWRGQGPVAVPGGVTVARRCGRLVPHRSAAVHPGGTTTSPTHLEP